MKKTKEQYISEIMERVDKMDANQREEFLKYLRSIQPEQEDKKCCCCDCQCKDGDGLCDHHAAL